ncbi:MAG: hypothetical protein AAF791_08245 [Bacteroidota bacterium]
MLRLTLSLFIVLALVSCGNEPEVPAPPGADATGTEAAAAPAGPEIVEGQLLGGDETLESGEYVDIVEVLVRDGQWLRVELLSGDFDPYLIVRSPTGNQTDVDDSQQGNLTASKAIVQATESGEWMIGVTTYEPGESGGYTLTYEVLDQRPADADEGRQIEAEEDYDPSV